MEYYNALAAKLFCLGANQFGIGQRGAIDADLVSYTDRRPPPTVIGIKH
jgi:hypothetical protein